MFVAFAGSAFAHGGDAGDIVIGHPFATPTVPGAKNGAAYCARLENKGAQPDRLLRAINTMGFGPMGTGGDTTAMAVHVDYAASHGFVPVVVSLNCWINRRTRARIHHDGRVERIE